MQNLQIFYGALNSSAILAKWENVARESNFGALAVFSGIVRDEGGISALSFDIYAPLLESWLESWQKRVDLGEFGESGDSSKSNDSRESCVDSSDSGESCNSKDSSNSSANRAKIFMAHAQGNVKVGECSFMCGIASKNRKLALAVFGAFIEDFKANAPIWKYDIKNGVRIYAKNRSQKLRGAGILARES